MVVLLVAIPTPSSPNMNQSVFIIPMRLIKGLTLNGLQLSQVQIITNFNRNTSLAIKK
jgi:hypothetical protein